MAAPSARKRPTEGPSPPVLAYLIAYNVAQVMGWSAMLFGIVAHAIKEQTYTGLYGKLAPLLNIFQTAAILEVVHCALGLVRANTVLTAFQVWSRVFLVWGVVYSAPVTYNVIGVPMFILAWTITEVVRYSFYICSLVGDTPPYGLLFCRYTFFIVLYPIGVTGELITIFESLEYVRTHKLFSIELPNSFNMSFNYYYYLIFTMLMYIPVFPQLYTHMLSQRKKVLGTTETKSKTD